MKMLNSISELKKGDTVIVKNCHTFESLGHKSISGDVFNIEAEKSCFTIKCRETEKFESINLKDGTIFLIS
jgi:hypothetical protein